MSLLTNADLTEVLGAVGILNSGADPETLPDRTLECVLSLIPNEMTAFDGFDTQGYYDGSLWYSPPGTVPLERVQLLAELIHEHPYFHQLINTSDQATTRTSDALPLAEFHKTNLYNEFYRTFGGEAQLSGAMRLSESSLITCSIHRPGLDFTDREHGKWKLLIPHLKAAFRDAQFIDELNAQKRYLQRANSRGLVVISERGQTLFESELAHTLLERYFNGSTSGGLPAEILNYVAGNSSAAYGKDYFKPAGPLVVSKGRSELRVTVSFDSRRLEVMIFLDERRPYSVDDFEGSGVTGREAEIIYWISRGKTDPDIGRLLSISPRTVQKHIEHIFAKLGVETRTAAVMSALDMIGGQTNP